MNELTVYINFTCDCRDQNQPQRVGVPGNFEGAKIKYTITDEVACKHCGKQPRFVQPELLIGEDAAQSSSFTSVKMARQDLVDGLVDGLSKVIEAKFESDE